MRLSIPNICLVTIINISFRKYRADALIVFICGSVAIGGDIIIACHSSRLYYTSKILQILKIILIIILCRIDHNTDAQQYNTVLMVATINSVGGDADVTIRGSDIVIIHHSNQIIIVHHLFKSKKC